MIQNIQYSKTEGVKTSYYSRYEKGGDLKQHQVYIQEQCKLKNDAALSYVFNVISQLAEGLDALHNGKFTDVEGTFHSGIVHNDLKPANIFVRENGDVVIADFGCAYYADQAAFQYGTLDFTAPELFLASTEFCKVSSKNALNADIFSLGVILTLLLQGKLPAKRINGYVIPSQLPDVLDSQFKFRKWAEGYENSAQCEKAREAKKYLEVLERNAPRLVNPTTQIEILKNLALAIQLPVAERLSSKELKDCLRGLAPYFGTPEVRAEKFKTFISILFASPQEEKPKDFLSTHENSASCLSR